MADAFVFEAGVDRGSLPAKVESEVKCQLELRSSADLVPAAAPVSTSLCLLFDCSASMMGRKLDAAIDAAKMIVDTVHQRHRVSLIGFQSRSHVLVDNIQATESEKATLRQKIERLRSLTSGSTNMSDGIKEAVRVIARQSADAKVMVILSDGRADSPEKAEAAALEATKAGIQVFAVGIGEGYEADYLLKLVTPSNGTVFGESDVQKIKAAFEQLIGRIESFVATHAHLAVTFAEGVRPGLAYKTSPEQAFIGKLNVDSERRAVLNLGNLERGETYGFVLVVTAPPRDAGPFELARAAVSYDVPSLNLRDQRKEVAIAVNYGQDKTIKERPEVAAAYQGARLAELVQDLADAHRKGDQKQAGEVLQKLINGCEQLGDTRLKEHYQGLLANLQAGALSRQKLNAAVVASTARDSKKKATRKEVQPPPPPPPTPAPVQASPPQPPPPPAETRKLTGAKLYDVVLVDPGGAVIRLIRELRAVTGLGLREVSNIVNSRLAIQESMELAAATALKERIESFGARVEVRLRAEPGAPPAA